MPCKYFLIILKLNIFLKYFNIDLRLLRHLCAYVLYNENVKQKI